MRQRTQLCTEREITEGTEVFLIDGKLKRALGSDWVEQCNQKRDAQGFIKLMDRLRAGETAVCPFCGGVVSMTASEDGKDIAFPVIPVICILALTVRYDRRNGVGTARYISICKKSIW